MASAGVKYKPNRAAQRAILNSDAVGAAVEREAERVNDLADSMGGATYAHDVRPGRNRVHGIVYTPSAHAIYSNARHKSLIKAITRLKE